MTENPTPILFEGRSDAGRQLAASLAPFRASNPVVLGLPRGGVVVAAEVAEALRAPLDVLVTRKLGAPGNEEYGIGAVGPGGVLIVDESAVRSLHISPRAIQRMVEKQSREMDRRAHLYRSDRPPLDVRGRTVIVVDDGLATGVTARAAVRSAALLGPARVVLAVPVCSREAAEQLGPEVDVFFSLHAPADFLAVGIYYRDFQQTGDEEVVSLLARNAATVRSSSD